MKYRVLLLLELGVIFISICVFAYFNIDSSLELFGVSARIVFMIGIPITFILGLIWGFMWTSKDKEV